MGSPDPQGQAAVGSSNFEIGAPAALVLQSELWLQTVADGPIRFVEEGQGAPHHDIIHPRAAACQLLVVLEGNGWIIVLHCSRLQRRQPVSGGLLGC